MANSQKSVVNGMRPNIRISHSLNGRVKDYADRNDMSFAEAYREIIETGLDELEAQEE